MTTRTQIGAITIDITPAHSVQLGASDNRSPRLSSGVASALEANLVAFRADSASLVVASLDVLFVGADLVHDVEEGLRNRGLSTIPDIVAVATHTHFAPMCDRTKPHLGTVDDRWYQGLVVKLSDAIAELCGAGGKACAIATTSGLVPGAINRRRRVNRPIWHRRRLVCGATIMGPNPAGARGDLASLAVLTDSAGRPVAALVTWACHPSSRPIRDQVSAEFIGFVRHELRCRLGAIPIIYLQGFCGDVRPDIPLPKTLRRLGRRLLRGPVFMQPSEAEWRAWATRVSEGIGQLANDPTLARSMPVHGPIVQRRARISLERILDRAPANRFLEARFVALGEQLKLFFLSAEPVADHATIVSRALPGAWTIGYLGDVFGYLPTNAQIAQGGYEVDGFQELFSLQARFINRNDEAVADLIARLGVRADAI